MPQTASRKIFVNLPVADVAKSTAFYEALGFTRDPRFSNEQASSLQWSDNIVVMILDREFYKGFTPGKDIADTARVSQVLLCLSFDSRDAVDDIVNRAVAAGGKADVCPKQDMGFMYGRSFEDLDGHIYEPMFMDMDAAMATFAKGAEAPAA